VRQHPARHPVSRARVAHPLAKHREILRWRFRRDTAGSINDGCSRSPVFRTAVVRNL
jgi:hypothetical protein